MWKNMVEPDLATDDNIKRMRFACWITEATNAHTYTRRKTVLTQAKIYIVV